MRIKVLSKAGENKKKQQTSYFCGTKHCLRWNKRIDLAISSIRKWGPPLVDAPATKSESYIRKTTESLWKDNLADIKKIWKTQWLLISDARARKKKTQLWRSEEQSSLYFVFFLFPAGIKIGKRPVHGFVFYHLVQLSWNEQEKEKQSIRIQDTFGSFSFQLCSFARLNAE